MIRLVPTPVAWVASGLLHGGVFLFALAASVRIPTNLSTHSDST
jgi:HAMP domain-containing protein